MQKEFVIGSDSGTQSVKTIVFDKSGHVISEGRATHTTYIPKPNWAEQDPREWWTAFCKSVKDALSKVPLKKISSIGITHQRCTLCVVRKDGEPLLPAQVWYDARPIKQVIWIRKKFGVERYLKIAGRMPDTSWWAQKVMWVRDNEPDIFEKAHKFLTVHGYFMYKLTGEFKDSYAAPTGLLDMANFKYSDELLEEFRIPREKLSDLYIPGEVIGYVSRKAAKETGLPEGLPVAAGAGDQQAGGLGCGVVESGMAYLNLGTSVVLGTVSPKYVFHKNFFVREGGVPATWNPEALLNSGFWLVTWFKDNFGHAEVEAAKACGIAPEEILELEAKRIPPGSLGLIVQPYWLGVRQPYWDEYARGSIIGWIGAHTKAHLYRAIIEGIAFDIRLNLEAMEDATQIKIKDLRMHGGGARSDLCCQIIADVLGMPVSRPHTLEATTLGAAILAAVAAKLYPDVKRAVANMSHPRGTFRPAMANNRMYNRLYKEIYKEIYENVQSLMRRIGKIV